MNPLAAIDAWLGRVSMYRLLTIGLLALAAVALGLSVTGAITWSPLALLASLTVAVLASVLAGRLAAAVARTQAHTESSVITGLILFFLFWPSTEPRYLGTLALAAASAAAAKYLLAVRGRHVVNPAAAGALVVGLTGWDATTWWVADRWLLVPVVLLALAVVRRTRRGALVGTFVVVAVVAITVRLMLEGNLGAAAGGPTVGSAAWTALTSYPVLFLGAVMLIEPLTLPPRRHQQLAEAVLVGVLLAVTFRVGPLSATPELALLIGNLVAFTLGQRGAVRLTMAGRRSLGPRTVELTLVADRPIRSLPGQYIELTVPHRHPDSRGTRRVFSLSSVPDPRRFTVTMTVPSRPSTFKRALLDLPVGARLTATGIGGDFLLPADPGKPLLLVAGGIGITPFAAQLAAATGAVGAAGPTGVPGAAHPTGPTREPGVADPTGPTGQRDRGGDLPDRRPARDVVVVHTVSDHGDLAYADVLRAAGARVLVASPTPGEPLPDGYLHLGVARPTAEALAEAVPDADQRIGYVSGPPAMVDTTRSVLRRAGVRRVHTDAFSGY